MLTSLAFASKWDLFASNIEAFALTRYRESARMGDKLDQWSLKGHRQKVSKA